MKVQQPEELKVLYSEEQQPWDEQPIRNSYTKNSKQ
jgi:hypothetical protein